MTIYAADAADAVADIQANGAAVTFTKTTRSSPDSSGATTITSASVAGSAIEVRGDPKLYEQLKLIPETTITLLFAANTLGQIPELGSSVTWAAKGYTVKWSRPTRPDGTAIVSRVLASL